MTTIEWILSLAVVAGLWIGALYFFFVAGQHDERENQAHQEAESIRNEIARWREASTRTYERQGIRRNR